MSEKPSHTVEKISVAHLMKQILVSTLYNQLTRIRKKPTQYKNGMTPEQ